MLRMVPLIVLAGALMLPNLPSARAEEPGETHKPTEAYAPGLGDFMTAYVQPHHIKLWLAGSVKNWALAEYEANELRETFEDIVTYQGNWHDYSVAKLVETVLTPPLGEVDQAIREKNAAGFAKAFDGLTAACNTCHQAVAHPFLVIKTPSADAFPDQDFALR